MIVKIQVRDDNCRYKNASAGDFAIAAFRQIFRFGGADEHGWLWMRNWLCRFCIQQAEASQGNHNLADRWYARYQALRQIA